MLLIYPIAILKPYLQFQKKSGITSFNLQHWKQADGSCDYSDKNLWKLFEE